MESRGGGRRRFLQGLGGSMMLAAAGGETLRRASGATIPHTHPADENAGASSATLRWPKPIGSPVLESLRPVIEHSRDVHTHVEKIVDRKSVV